jgi:hypothetical protein
LLRRGFYRVRREDGGREWRERRAGTKLAGKKGGNETGGRMAGEKVAGEYGGKIKWRDNRAEK